jgi:molecular chaperone GrpE (heat shock protein)
MNETEIKWRKQLLKSLANITDHTSSEYEIISNGVKTISFLEQENEKLKERIEYLERSNNRREDTILEQRQEISNLEDNWNKLKQKIIDSFNKTQDMQFLGVLQDMQELRQGSDEQ